jgi:hypothetical protein
MESTISFCLFDAAKAEMRRLRPMKSVSQSYGQGGGDLRKWVKALLNWEV